MKIYVAVRENGDFLEEVNSIQEGLEVIKQYEENDKQEGIYKENFYDLVDESHCSIEY